MSEIPKTYDPQAVEHRWYEFWLKQGCFAADAKSSKPAYSIVIPPPNVTGMLHMGHVLNNTIQDILARKARMDGKEVLWLPGTDHAGIATQVMVEKQIKKEEHKTRYDLGREEFLKRVWKWKEKHGDIIIQQLKKLGCSCDWTRERFTMDPAYSRCVQKVFVDLYKKGLIYRGKRMVNWCPATLTALSDEEVDMEPQKSSLWYFKVEVDGEPNTFLTIATTRPETIPGDTAIAVNPNDPRYSRLIGKRAVRPLPRELPHEKKLIPIIADAHIDPEFGTGVLKVTPAHDQADFEIGQRHKLPAIDIMNPDATMNDLAGEDLAGLDRFEARAKASELLRAMDAMVKEEPYENKVGFSQRAKVPIEPRLSEQWFLKYPKVESAKATVAQDGYISPTNLLAKTAEVVQATGREISGKSIRELRKAALAYARQHRIIGTPFKNADTGLQIRVGRQSLSHAFSHPGVANILAVVVLPELIQTAVWVSSEPHQPRNPMIKTVHRFVAALSLAEELYGLVITAKEFHDGTVLYDHKAKKIAPGGKSLEAHPREGKLDTQPAPSTHIRLGDLPAGVNLEKMRFHPQRWAKVYDHWLTHIQDWCISRQLWWGHRIPVWYPKPKSNDEKTPAGAADYWCDINPPPDPENWEQDPDVLDTWFSSWLWPFGTMGWTGDHAQDSKNPTLGKFYPTTDLVTGPDIIFFWVARMIMAGYEFMGDRPFHNVYFTGIIRDKLGRKMSKTLGNSPDPLDLIGKYGADALRFGTMRSAPLGQDVLFDEKDVELGRNFCNKLWNACRFRQMQGGEVQGEIDPKLLTSDDKWILLKLDRAIRELSDAFREYKFNEATATLYRFFWSEYCDWYVEASKAALARPVTTLNRQSAATDSPARSDSDATRQRCDDVTASTRNPLAVIDFVLSHTLRLFHPFLPFITEELWHGMGYAEDMPASQGGATIMTAPWPKPFAADFKTHYGLSEEDEKQVETRNDFVAQGRNLRRTGNIPANKKVKFVFKPAGPVAPHDREVIRLLLNAETVEVNPQYQPPKGTPTVRTPIGELCLPLAGLLDVAAEKARLQKELQKIAAEIAKAEQKLANPNFAQKAPAHVLAEHQRRLAEWRDKREHAQQALDALR